jgi:hypothetical protein
MSAVKPREKRKDPSWREVSPGRFRYVGPREVRSARAETWRDEGFESRGEVVRAIAKLKRALREIGGEHRRRERKPARNIKGRARRELEAAKRRRREREAERTGRT